MREGGAQRDPIELPFSVGLCCCCCCFLRLVAAPPRLASRPRRLRQLQGAAGVPAKAASRLPPPGHAPAMEASGFSAALSGAFLGSGLLFAALNREQRAPYMDEAFHVAQAQAYCQGRFQQVGRERASERGAARPASLQQQEQSPPPPPGRPWRFFNGGERPRRPLAGLWP